MYLNDNDVICRIISELHRYPIGQPIGCGSFEFVYQSSWKGKNVALKHTDVPSGVDKEYMITSSHELAAVRYITIDKSV